MVDNCTAIKYPTSWNMQREPARPQHLRIDYFGGMKFNENFDWHNAWYDVIQVHENAILLIGPPLYDSKNWINTNIGFFDSQNNKLSAQFMELDRVCYTVLTSGFKVDDISMTGMGETQTIPIRQTDHTFDGKKVLMTLQKNNPIAWIKQWIDYHVTNLGIDGYLIYDNASTDYSANVLEQELARPDATIKIVSWPYLYGPQGSDYAPWDSDYGQHVMLEHAKHRYLHNAALVLNNDIDELIVTKGITLEDIRSYLMQAPAGCLKYKGIWIEPYDYEGHYSASQVAFDHRKFSQYYCTDDSNSIGIGYKWMLIPQRNMNCQWLVHNITGPALESTQLYYGHYLAMNTNWSWKRDEYKGNPLHLKPEPWLKDNLTRMHLK